MHMEKREQVAGNGGQGQRSVQIWPLSWEGPASLPFQVQPVGSQEPSRPGGLCPSADEDTPGRHALQGIPPQVPAGPPPSISTDSCLIQHHSPRVPRPWVFRAQGEGSTASLEIRLGLQQH